MATTAGLVSRQAYWIPHATPRKEREKDYKMTEETLKNAAQEMYDALKKVAPLLEDHAFTINMYKYFPYYEAVKNAIYKAEGA
jgi:hypothetical protein